jgi:hypothetical protein
MYENRGFPFSSPTGEERILGKKFLPGVTEQVEKLMETARRVVQIC